MAPSTGHPALRGRSDELEQLDGWLRRVASGTLQVALLEGEAGIGKTRMLDEILARAAALGVRTAIGRADELERLRPFGPLAAALGCDRVAGDPERREAYRLLSGAGGESALFDPTRDPGLLFRVVDALVDVVEREALTGPIVLALEDLHWSDASTLVALRSVTRRLRYLPVGVLATMRIFPRPPELERLVDAVAAEGASYLRLRSLEAEAVAELVAELLGEEPSERLLRKVDGAGGNPLFVTELVRALADEGSLDGGEIRTDLEDVSLPPSLRLTILRRLTFLHDDVLQLLRTGSALGSTFSLRDAATVLERSSTGLMRAVEEAVRAEILEEQDTRLGFRHELMREAIYEDLPEDVRAALHVEAARRLAAAAAPASQVAEQFALGARPGDVDAVSWLQAAARHAGPQSPGTAVEFLERALELTDSDDGRHALLVDLVPALLWAGRPREAEERARAALSERPALAAAGSLLVAMIQALTVQGRTNDVVDEVDRALTELELPSIVRSQLLAEKANALGFAVDLDASEHAARSAIAIGEPSGAEGSNMGLLVLSDCARVSGRLDEALAHAELALQRARERPAGRPRWPPEIFVAMALRGLDRFEEAHQAIAGGRHVDERLGNVSYLPVYDYESANLFFDAADWDEATTQAEAGLALADDVGLGMLLAWPHGIVALVAVYRGDLDAAASSLEAIENRAPASERSMGSAPQPGIARALLAEAQGDQDDALGVLEDAWDFDIERGIVQRRRLLGPPLARLARAAGDQGRADEVARALEEAARLAPVPSLVGAALRCRGLADDDADTLVRSVDAYRQGPRLFDGACASEEAAGALARYGRIDAARPLYDAALDIYERAGARWAAARTLAAMRVHGLGRKRRGARKRPLRGWEALTPSELEVVQLAAEGLTNPEIGRRLFVSRRTVQTHLGHAFRKLGLSSRVELAAEVARRAPAEESAIPTPSR